MNTLHTVITAPMLELSCVHYASPKPLSITVLHQKAGELLKAQADGRNVLPSRPL